MLTSLVQWAFQSKIYQIHISIDSGAAFFIFGGSFPMLSAFSVVSLHLIPGQFSSWFGANNLLLGARRFRSFSVMSRDFATWYSLSQYIWSSKLLQSTCSHEICETSPQSSPFRLVTWSASGSGSGSEENGRLNFSIFRIRFWGSWNWPLGNDESESPKSSTWVTGAYSQLSPRRTPLGPALAVRLREMSVLWRVK